MKQILIIIFVIVIVLGLWWMFFKQKPVATAVKNEPLKVLTHSSAFNASVAEALKSYFDMKDAFVNADSVKVIEADKNFMMKLDSVKMNDLSKDTSAIYQAATEFIGDMKGDAAAIPGEKNITDMRQNFRMISENLYPFLKTIKYEGPALYWQNCPMAFGENNEANWISNTKEIINPYMGMKHPEYKSAMLHCGETKDTIK